ncbi:MAG: AMP-binding protein [Acidimicrobiia bacterium]
MNDFGIFAVAERDPGRRALVDPSGQEASYGELVAGMNAFARGLRSLGLSSGDTVAVVLGNSRELLELYGAAVQTGLTFVALNWHLGVDELAYILTDSGAKVVVAHERFADVARGAAELAGIPLPARFAVGDTPGFRPLAELVAGQPVAALGSRQAGQVMFYTSGTTGRPKGVRKRLAETPVDEIALITGIGLRASSFAAIASTHPEHRVDLVCGPMYHAAPIAGACGALDNGAFLVMVDHWTPEDFLEKVERYRVTNVSMVPTMFHRLLALPEETRARADVSPLQMVSHAGAPCPVDVKRRMIEWWGPIIVESYSSTEGAGTTVTAEEWLRKPGTVGQPSPGVVLRILDDDGNDCAPGAPGLVYVSQTMWQFDYHNDPGKTAANRRGDLFTVGDIGYVDDDGYLFLCDRQADVIISGGVNVYPAEVEATLLTHPAVVDAAVVGAPSDEWGEEVTAVVEMNVSTGTVPGHELAQDLIEFCRARLAHYKCPRAVDFVDSLGRDPNGKLRKKAIRDRYWEGRDRKI